jgi:PIN domain nuclease of toxin-antitoxin system
VLDLWYLSQTRGALTAGQLDTIVELLGDPTSGLVPVPITLPVAGAFGQIPLTVMRDPWDRLITATVVAEQVASAIRS